LLLRKFKEAKGEAAKKLQDIDLSSLRVHPNAAEPIDYFTLRKYVDEFKGIGLKTDIVLPSYGLAEHTLVATTKGFTAISVDRKALEAKEVIIRDKAPLFGEKRLVESDETQVLVSCGIVGAYEVKLVIVDPETRIPVAAGAVRVYAYTFYMLLNKSSQLFILKENVIYDC